MSHERPCPRSIVLVFLLSLTLSGCQKATEPTADAAAAEIAQVENGLLPPAHVAGEPGRSLTERMAYHDVPGVSVAVIHDFELAWARGYGVADQETGQPVTTETLFQAASISKPVAAAAALRWVEEGSLALDAPINDFLESWQLPANDLTRETPVTLRHLLSHTGGTTVDGFPGYAVDAVVPTLTQVLDGEPPANTAAIRVDIAPGSRFRYSGGGISIVQQALVDVSGKSFPELMRERVLSPLAMSASTYEQPLPPERLAAATAGHGSAGKPILGKRHTYPEMAAAGLWTTPSDLARFAIAIQRAVRGDEATLLSRETVREMLTPIDSRAGLGLFVEQRGDDATYFQHGGANAGYRCVLIAHRDAGYGAAVMTNSGNGGRLYTEILRAVARVYGWQDYLEEPVEPIAVDPEQLDAYLGRYRITDDQVGTISRVGDRLLGRRSLVDKEPFWFIPVAEHTFVAQYSGLRVRFRLDENGRATSLVDADPQSDQPPRERLADDSTSPVELLDAGRTDEAVAAYREIGAEEGRLNLLGYTLLRLGKTAQAVAILRLNTELYPDSANTWDSLADAYLADDDLEQATAAWRQVLETLPRDSVADPETRKLLRTKAEAHLARIDGHG